MSFKAKLKVAGKEYNVLSVSYALFQETDATGRPSTVTRGGKIDVVVESTGEADFFEWMTNSRVSSILILGCAMMRLESSLALLFIAVTIRSIAGTEKSWRNSLQISVLISPWQLDGTKALSSTS